ncbi:MAG: ABC transporter permease [Silvibacterium sp.]
MRRLRALWLRVRGMFASGRAEAEFSAELESHLAMNIEDGVRAGLSREEARRQALIRLGGMEQAKIAQRERRGLPKVEALGRDVAYGVRTLRKNPGFAIVSILVIAIGIGANAALFTVVRSVLLRPLPFADPDRLVMMYGHNPDDPDSRNVVAAGDFYEWQKASQGFEQMAIWRWSGYNLSGQKKELPEMVSAAYGSWNLFSMLGVQPVLGRSFDPNDDKAGASRTVILNWGLFKRRFNGDPAIVGKTIRLNSQTYTVVGVLPGWFTYPDPEVQLWTPYRLEENPQNIESHFNHMGHVIARLKPGVSREQATQQVSGVQHQLFLRYNNAGPVVAGVTSQPLVNEVVGEVKKPLYILMGAVGCLLLIACLNLSNLLVARSAARRKEIAIRTALGSGRARLCREQLTESLLICVAGGALGLVLAVWATRWLTTRWVDMPRAEAVHPDGVVVAFAVGITLVTGILSGLLPALSATGRGVLSALQDASRTIGGSASRASLRKVLLTAEIALTVVLLVCAGLLFKSFLRLRSVDLGCRTDNVLTMKFFLRRPKYAQPEQIVAFHTGLLEKVRALPGVEGAGLTNVVPGDGYYGDTGIRFPEHPPLPPGVHQFAIYRTADPGYFSAMGIPLVRGRVFTEDERGMTNDKYIVINQQFAREYFPNEDSIGKHVFVSWESDPGDAYEVIGIVGDTLYALDQPVKPMIWFPILSGNPVESVDAMLVVHSRGRDVTPLALPIQKLIAQMDPDLPVSRVLTMEQIVGESTANSSFSATLVLAFAGLSLLLAAVGLYGVLSYLVTQRTTEIGIRIALGARRSQLLQLVMLDGLRPAFVGLALGIAGSVGATQLIRSVLYATRPLDAVVYVSVIVTLLLAAAAACLVPAWRATRVNPIQALRAE